MLAADLPIGHPGIAMPFPPCAQGNYHFLAARIELVFTDMLGGHEEHATRLVLHECAGPANGIRRDLRMDMIGTASIQESQPASFLIGSRPDRHADGIALVLGPRVFVIRLLAEGSKKVARF